MQVIFRCRNPYGHCQAMVMTYLGLQCRGINVSVAWQVGPPQLALLQDAYDSGAHVHGLAPLTVRADRLRAALQLFGFHTIAGTVISGTRADSFAALNALSIGDRRWKDFRALDPLYNGERWFGFRWFGLLGHSARSGPRTEGHALAVRVAPAQTFPTQVPPHWDLFDPNHGLFQYDSADEFRHGVRRHLYEHHADLALGDWAVILLPTPARTATWPETVARLTSMPPY